jgi:integrase/recombinase XerD
MSELREAVEQYLATRRSLGYKLREPAACLRRFATFVEEAGASYITTDLALRWARQSPRAQPTTWAYRLGIARRFAAWRRTMDPRTQVPPEDILPYRYRRKPPYIYTDAEIEKLITAAGGLPSSKGLRALSYSTVFGLLAATGMRISEAIQLDRQDVDLEKGIITIRQTKFGKSRLVPLHASTRDALRAYARERDDILSGTMPRAFFVSDRGRRITDWSTRYNFAKVSRRVGLRASAGGYRHGRGPRLHDMRHRFAAKTLIQWYRAGLDVEREIPKLSAYLGHVHVSDTYWYIEAVPELLQLATRRLEEKEATP